jgi:DNA-directed RNA polymerase subunit RPC12/RpoP
MKSKNITPGIIYTTRRGWRSMADALDDFAEIPGIKTLGRNKDMKSENKTNGFASHTNGFARPLPGNGFYICHKCRNRFNNTRERIFSEIFGDLLVRCPECGSFHVARDPAIVY